MDRDAITYFCSRWQYVLWRFLVRAWQEQLWGCWDKCFHRNKELPHNSY